MSDIRAVLFDYSGTLFRLEEDESWLRGVAGRLPVFRIETVT